MLKKPNRQAGIRNQQLGKKRKRREVPENDPINTITLK
jgi:hypothetical protein